MTSAPRTIAALALVALSGASACASSRVVAPVKPPPTLLFESFTVPADTNFESTPIGSRRGSAKVQFLQDPIFTGLPIITWGDASVATAAAKGGIREIHYVDYDVLSVLGIYLEVEVHVSGD